MTVLAADRVTNQYGVPDEVHPLLMNFGVKASTIIYGGGLVAINAAGYAVPASADITLRVVGRAEKKVDNSAGANGALTVDVKPGAFLYNIGTSGDALTVADLLNPVYVVDDNTVGRVSSNGSRPVAGVLLAIVGTQAAVAIGFSPAPVFGLDPTGTLPAYVSNDSILTAAGAIQGGFFDVPTTGAASTVTLPAAAPHGTVLYFMADGTKNGHTVTYRDATGPTALTTALTASKRHLVVATKFGANWFANAYISP